MVRKLDVVALENEKIRYSASACGGAAASLLVAVIFDYAQKGNTSWFTWNCVLCAFAVWYIGRLHLSWLRTEEE